MKGVLQIDCGPFLRRLHIVILTLKRSDLKHIAASQPLQFALPGFLLPQSFQELAVRPQDSGHAAKIPVRHGLHDDFTVLFLNGDRRSLFDSQFAPQFGWDHNLTPGINDWFLHN
jgi:hypothetical protein